MPSQLMNVTPENVLQARALILAEAQSFMEHLNGKFLRPGAQMVGLCGGDPISRDAQELFNNKIRENAVSPAQQYVQRLQKVADQLADTARAFGITEELIAASFRPAADQASRA